MSRQTLLLSLAVVTLQVACTPTCPPTELERQAFQRCDASPDATSCASNGGTGFVNGHCVCESETEGCGCRTPRDCLGTCVAEPAPGADGLPFDCTGHPPATCVGQAGGCGCYLQDDGSARGICLDR